MPSYENARLALLHAFHAPQTEGELGEDFDLKATSDVTKEIAAEMVLMLPRKTRRALERVEQDFVAKVLQAAIAKGFVAGARWRSGAGE